MSLTALMQLPVKPHKMIKEAKKLQASGNAAGAVALANKAHTQTVNAAAQTVGAGSAGPSF